MFGLYGFGFIMSGLTIIFTKTASFSFILNYFFLFFTGAIINIEALPSYLQIISKTLPLTVWIFLAKDITLTGLSLSALLTGSRLWLLGLNSACHFTAGLLFFKLVYSHSKKSGILKQY